MFGIGFTELILIAIVALIVLGPERCVELSKDLGRLIGELRRMAVELKGSVKDSPDNPQKHP